MLLLNWVLSDAAIGSNNDDDDDSDDDGTNGRRRSAAQVLRSIILPTGVGGGSGATAAGGSWGRPSGTVPGGGLSRVVCAAAGHPGVWMMASNDYLPPSTSFSVYSRTLMGCTDPLLEGGSAHPISILAVR